jgi:hypothetical protein
LDSKPSSVGFSGIRCALMIPNPRQLKTIRMNP